MTGSQSQVEWAGRIKAAVVPALRRIAPALAAEVEAIDSAKVLIDSPWRFLAEGGRLDGVADRWEEVRAARPVAEYSLWKVPSEFGSVAVAALYDEPGGRGRMLVLVPDGRGVAEMVARPGDPRGERDILALASNPRRAVNLTGWISG